MIERKTVDVIRTPAHDSEGDDHEKATIEYEQRDDAWYVKTPVDEEFWKFAQSSARSIDVEQLINKKWDAFYGGTDDLENRS